MKASLMVTKDNRVRVDFISGGKLIDCHGIKCPTDAAADLWADSAKTAMRTLGIKFTENVRGEKHAA